MNGREHDGGVAGSGHVEPGCAEALAKLQDLIDGELPASSAPRIMAHLEACPPCGFEREAFERIKAAVASCGNYVDAESMQRLRTFASRVAEFVDDDPS
ncbi:MAG: zf-HC2 domain-containing protein [Actinobacteria bacterium]|nr:zf-HC2 domain-containing protein [Actinomycetota bacterium]